MTPSVIRLSSNILTKVSLPERAPFVRLPWKDFRQYRLTKGRKTKVRGRGGVSGGCNG